MRPRPSAPSLYLPPRLSVRPQTFALHRGSFSLADVRGFVLDVVDKVRVPTPSNLAAPAPPAPLSHLPLRLLQVWPPAQAATSQSAPPDESPVQLEPLRSPLPGLPRRDSLPERPWVTWAPPPAPGAAPAAAQSPTPTPSPSPSAPAAARRQPLQDPARDPRAPVFIEDVEAEVEELERLEAEAASAATRAAAAAAAAAEADERWRKQHERRMRRVPTEDEKAALDRDEL